MKLYSIVLFLFIFNLSLGLIQAEPLFTQLDPDAPPIYIGQSVDANQTGSTLNASDMRLSIPTDPTDVFGVIVAFLSLLVSTITGLPTLLGSLGCPAIITTALSACLLLVYAATLLQLISGRMLKFME